MQKSKKTPCVQKKFFLNPSACTFENGKYLENIIGDTVIMCDEVTEVTKTVPAKTFLIILTLFFMGEGVTLCPRQILLFVVGA